MSNSRPTQCDRILRHLKDYGSLTSLEAITEYGIMRLASRVSELRKKGYNIQVKYESGRNRYGEPVSWARYYMPAGLNCFYTIVDDIPADRLPTD